MSNLKKINNAMLALLVTIFIAIIDMKGIVPIKARSLRFIVQTYVYIYFVILAYKNRDRIRSVGTRFLRKFGYYLIESSFIGAGVYHFYRYLPGARANGKYILVCFVAIFYVMSLIYHYGFMITDRKQVKKYSVIAAIMWILHDSVYLLPANDMRPDESTAIILLLLFGGVLAFCFFDFTKFRRIDAWKQKHNVISTYTMYVVVMWLIFVTLETLSNTFVFDIPYQNWPLNLLWIFLVSGLIFLVTRKLKLGLSITLVIWVVIGLSNGFILLFRGSPVLPADLFLISTARKVSANYSYRLPYYMVEGLYIAIFTLVLISRMVEYKPKKKGYFGFFVPFATAAILAYPILSWNTNTFASSINLWMPIFTYKEFGTVTGFNMNVLKMQVKEPKGYSKEAAKEVLNGYESDEADTSRTPNIIVIMDESFADLTQVGKYETNKEVMPYYNSLKDNIIKGTAYSSVLGGTTANSEFEFQTGNATAFLPTGTVPYQQYIQGNTNSFTRTLKSLGYSATAFHTYERNTYRREIVYPLLGFDQYDAMDTVKNPKFLRTYITDETDFKNVIKHYEKRDKESPFYIFNVTMQNHSAYDTQSMDYNIKLKGDKEYKEAEEYLSCISHTDESIKILIDYFSKVDEETYIVFYGDHQPNFYSDFFDQLLGGPMTDLKVQDLQKRYMVPFFIWSNKEMESKTVDKISLNYLSSYFLQEAKLPMTAYNKYLMDLFKKYPVVNINGYIDAEGNYFDAGQIKDNEDLVDYNKLVYNTIIDKTDGLNDAYKLK